MKKTFALILFLACNTLIYSQVKDSLLIGEWKVISIETHNYYYNSINDTFSWSKDFEKMLPKLIKDFGYKNSEEFSEETKKKTTNDKFIFQKDSSYLRKSGAKILREGNYKIITSKKTIYFKDKDKPEYSMKYFINKDLLYLTIDSKGKIRPTEFILQKTTIL